MIKLSSLLLVRHSKTNIGRVQSYLERKLPDYKSIFLEMYSYPQKSSSEDSDSFWNSIYEYLMKQPVKIILGDSEELTKKAEQRIRLLTPNHIESLNSFNTNDPILQIVNDYKRELSREREFYFLSVIRKEQPELIIIGEGHKNCLEGIVFGEVVSLV